MRGLEHRGDADLAAEFRSFHEKRRVQGQHLADHQPIKQHAQPREMLFDRGRTQRALFPFDVGGHVQRPDLPQCQAMLLAPGKELMGGLEVSGARIPVADLRGKKLEKTFAGVFAGRRNQSRGGHACSRESRQDFERSVQTVSPGKG